MQYADGKSNFQTPFPLINSVLQNLQGGRLFTNEQNEIFFILHKASFSYVVTGNIFDAKAILDIFSKSVQLPKYFHVYDASVKLLALCNKNTDVFNIKVRNRVQLKLVHFKTATRHYLLPKHYRVSKINDSNFNSLKVFNLSVENKFWKSKQDFLTNGFGFIIIDEADHPASVCYTACLANKTAEIDIATLPFYQGRGLAAAVAEAFIGFCAENDFIACWDCFEDNKASLRVAQNLGFTADMTYRFLSIYNKNK